MTWSLPALVRGSGGGGLLLMLLLLLVLQERPVPLPVQRHPADHDCEQERSKGFQEEHIVVSRSRRSSRSRRINSSSRTMIPAAPTQDPQQRACGPRDVSTQTVDVSKYFLTHHTGREYSSIYLGWFRGSMVTHGVTNILTATTISVCIILVNIKFIHLNPS